MSKIHRNGSRLCPFCGSILKKNGLTKFGSQRWYCKKCKKSCSPNKKLKDVLTKKSLIKFYIKFLLNKAPLIYYSWTKRRFSLATKKIRAVQIKPLCDILSYSKVIYLDAIYFANECCMIARNDKKVIGWRFCQSECRYEWFEFIRNFPAPEYVVCDGGCGLISAINEAWPNTKHQRCLFHVWMSMRRKLTLNPHTIPGKELLKISRDLLRIESNNEKQIWLDKFKEWKNKWYQFTCEKSINHETGEIWFTHKKLRSAAWNLGKLILENHLFYYLNDSDVQRTNNLLEGGINSPLKALLYVHRNCTKDSKRKLIEFYLLKRSNYFKYVTHMLYTKIK